MDAAPLGHEMISQASDIEAKERARPCIRIRGKTGACVFIVDTLLVPLMLCIAIRARHHGRGYILLLEYTHYSALLE